MNALWEPEIRDACRGRFERILTRRGNDLEVGDEPIVSLCEDVVGRKIGQL